MIEDKEDQVKIAENPKEALIERTLTTANQRLIEAELSIEIEKEVIRFLESKLKKE